MKGGSLPLLFFLFSSLSGSLEIFGLWLRLAPALQVVYGFWVFSKKFIYLLTQKKKKRKRRKKVNEEEER